MTASKKLTLRAMLIASAAIGVTPTLALADPSSCYERTIAWCNSALQSSPWYEKWIIGDACVGMMAGCALR